MNDLKEKLVTAGFFTGIFLPIRLLFYSFVSKYWLGSFGLITIVLVTLMYFSNKGKLGRLGIIVNRQVQSFATGKFGLFSIIWLLFMIYLCSMIIYGVNNPPQEVKAQFKEVLNTEGINDLESATHAQNIGWSGPAAAYGVLFSILVLLVPNKIAFTLYSIIDDWTFGWLVHFSTVILIGSIEELGLILYFRYKKYKVTIR